MKLPQSARELIESGSLAHLVTLNTDGSPQVTCIWVGLEQDEIISGHLNVDQQKLRNIARDPRVALSIEGTEIQPPGLKQYLIVHGRARVVEGGAPELLQRLAHVYLGPDVTLPPMADRPPAACCTSRSSGSAASVRGLHKSHSKPTASANAQRLAAGLRRPSFSAAKRAVRRVRLRSLSRAARVGAGRCGRAASSRCLRARRCGSARRTGRRC